MWSQIKCLPFPLIPETIITFLRDWKILSFTGSALSDSNHDEWQPCNRSYFERLYDWAGPCSCDPSSHCSFNLKCWCIHLTVPTCELEETWQIHAPTQQPFPFCLKMFKVPLKLIMSENSCIVHFCTNK